MGGKEDGKITQFLVEVKTGTMIGSGTIARVWLSLINKKGVESQSHQINLYWWNYFSLGSTREIMLELPPDFGHVCAIKITRGFTPKSWGDWYPELLTVKNVENGDYSVFPVHRWIRQNQPIILKEFDAYLPHNDDHHTQRKEELDEIRDVYKPKVHVPGLLPQVETLPWQDHFLLSDQFSIGWLKVKLKAHMTLFNVLHLTSEWGGYDEIEKLYNAQLPRPISFSGWKTDEAFGEQRLNHCNPTQIRLCRRIPEKFAVSEEMLSPLLEGMTIESAIKAKKLYYVDYNILEDLNSPNDRIVCAPFGLFFVNSVKKLVPIAIQLFQEPCEQNPVFLPTDDVYVWLCAKIWFNNADASFHQSCTHLGFTHLILEPIALATHHTLSRSHPLYRLLAPHFLYLFAINSRGLKLLIAPGEWVDKCMTIGVNGMMRLISKELGRWRLDVQGTLPRDLEERGVDDTEALPGYHYRDDALLIYDAIRKYVTEIVSMFYDNEHSIKRDYELQNWARSLSDPYEKDGFGIPGVHGGGKLESVEEVVSLCTSIIFIASVSHAASNFSQYDDYGYPPNYPALLNGKPMTDKSPLTEEDVQRLLPGKDVMMDTLVITRLLSMRATQSLGDFEVQYLFHPDCEAAVNKFRLNLNEIGKEIDKRNMKRSTPYTYLHPKQIPNSISI